MKPTPLLCALLCLALPTFAAEREAPWEGRAFEAPPAAVAKAAAKLPAPEGADIEILLKEGHYTELAPHRWRSTTRHVFRLLTDAGVREWAEVRADWSPWRQGRPQVRARVISPDGQVHPLDESTLHDAPVEDAAPGVYSDTRALRAPLPALKPGSIVEEEVVVEDTRPFFEAGVVTHFYFASPVPVRKVRLGIDTDPATQLTLRVQGLPLEPQPQLVSERKRLTFEGGPYAPMAALEEDVPPAEAFYPHVAFSTGKSWSDVAGAYHRIVEERLAGAALQTKARALAKGTKDRAVLAQRLLEYVQDSVRYTGLEFGAAAIVPAPPQEVLARQFGDCKEMSTLLVGLLRGAGVPAHVALVRSGREDVPELPGMGFFNHAIVYVPGTPALWIDPTDPGAEAGTLAPELQGRHALVAAPETQGLTRIDEAPPARNTAVFTRTVVLADEGPARVRETRELEGSLAVQYRRLLRAMRPADFRRNLEALATAQYQGTLEGMKHTPLDDSTGPFRLELDVKAARFATTGWRTANVPLRIDSPLAWLPSALDDVRDLLPDELGRKPAAPARRKADLVLPVAYQAEARYRLRPPPGFAVRTVPRDEALRLGPATLALRYTREADGGLTATFRFDAVKRRYTPDEVAAFRTALVALARREPLVVELEDRGSRLVDSGRVKDGLSVYEKLLSPKAESALVRARYAGTLLRLGFGEQARAEARRAVTQREGSPLVHHVLAWVLQHDLHGRARGTGADLEGAVASVRKAVALEPEDVASTALLAELLEYNRQGERFGQGAPLPEALATWRHLRDELEARDMDDRLLLALFRSGATAEALEAARAAAPSELRDRVLVMAVAEAQGAKEAVAEAGKSIEGLDARREALALAANHLLTRRRYADAAQLFEEALRGAYDPELQARLELARKVRRVEDAKPDAGAQALVRRVVLAAWTSRTTQEFEAAIRPSISMRDKLGSELRRTLKVMHEQAARYIRRANLDAAGVAAMADLSVAALDLKVDGQDKVGYRVSLKVPLGARSYEDVWYVARENKEYRLLASALDPRPLGAEALRWFDANRFKEAMLWVGWAIADARELPSEDLSPLASFVQTLRGFSGAEGITDLRRASAYLGASTGDARVIATLQSQGTYAAGEQRHRLLVALAVAYRAAGKLGDANALLSEVQQEVPASAAVFWLKRDMLTEQGRWEQLRDVADGRLGFLHTDSLGLDTLLVAAVNQGDWDVVAETGKRLEKLGTAGPSMYRTLAWGALSRGRASMKDVERAQQAVTLTGNEDPESLALLAALLVETGRLEEARQLADTAVAQGASDKVDGGVLYVRGRLAEAYGLPEAARALYRAVPPEEQRTEDARSFHRLAKARLSRGRGNGTATASARGD